MTEPGENLQSASGEAEDSRLKAVFDALTRHREHLNRQLDHSRRDLDAWLDALPAKPTFPALGRLEVLLMTRRKLLAELVQLDDEFVVQLHELRQG